MVLYISIILICMAIISVLNIFCGTGFFGYTPWQVIGLVCFSVVAEIVIDLILAGFVYILPNKWFGADVKFFCVDKKERRFYEKLGIKHWKDKVLELGAICGFRKNKIKDGSNPEYLNRFILESNKGIIIHILNAILGFLVIFCIPLKYWLVISIPVAVVNAFLATLPTFILRYNIPKLKVAMQRAIRTQKQKEAVTE